MFGACVVLLLGRFSDLSFVLYGFLWLFVDWFSFRGLLSFGLCLFGIFVVVMLLDFRFCNSSVFYLNSLSGLLLIILSVVWVVCLLDLDLLFYFAS